MSVSALTNIGFNFAQFNQNRADAVTSGANSSAASLTLRVATIQSQNFASLLNAAFAGNSAKDSANDAGIFDVLTSSTGSSSDALGNVLDTSSSKGLSASGRNTALFDPESAYRMMSVINYDEVSYKAQFSEMSQMKSWLSEMQQDAQSLGGISLTSSDDSIRASLQTFTDQYNAWVKRFDADMQSGSLLADTQAAQVSRYELEQSVENMFNGASDGLHGLRDLGLTIDPYSNLATLDSTRLDAVLASNKQGVVDTVQQFSANFAKSAELLNSDGNFIPKRLNNLSRAIAYIEDNKSSLQAEFGLGDAAKPSGLVAQALAAYQQMSGKTDSSH
ncbi:flagellar filament capping protein FliD [Rhodocyclus tenuis]|uniref:flagellar filament capping protein FliD n=1 Tax=Rhodocyclus tenuis TaxID=1066 RepID=UPI001885235F|nr:flagellar filament capping protein FliD [Rhodocyclus tenuis]